MRTFAHPYFSASNSANLFAASALGTMARDARVSGFFAYLRTLWERYVTIFSAKPRVSSSWCRPFSKNDSMVSFNPMKLTRRDAFSTLKYWSPSAFCVRKGRRFSLARCLIVRYFISKARKAISSCSSSILKKASCLPFASYATLGKFIITLSMFPVCRVSSSQSPFQSVANLHPVAV